MDAHVPPDVPSLLQEWQAGSTHALRQAIPLIYEELRRLTSRALSDRHVQTLQTTALIHEACARLAGPARLDWQCRSRLFALAAQCMRRILVSHARYGGAQSGPGPRVALDDEASAEPMAAVDIAALDRALSELEALDRQQGRIVELRYFGGLTIEETADVLGAPPVAVTREWDHARAWLSRQLGSSASGS